MIVDFKLLSITWIKKYWWIKRILYVVNYPSCNEAKSQNSSLQCKDFNYLEKISLSITIFSLFYLMVAFTCTNDDATSVIDPPDNCCACFIFILNLHNNYLNFFIYYLVWSQKFIFYYSFKFSDYWSKF